MAFRRSPVRSRSGPPSFAHECRRRMPRPSVAKRRGGGPVLSLNEFGSASHARFTRRLPRRSVPKRRAGGPGPAGRASGSASHAKAAAPGGRPCPAFSERARPRQATRRMPRRSVPKRRGRAGRLRLRNELRLASQPVGSRPAVPPPNEGVGSASQPSFFRLRGCRILTLFPVEWERLSPWTSILPVRIRPGSALPLPSDRDGCVQPIRLTSSRMLEPSGASTRTPANVGRRLVHDSAGRCPHIARYNPWQPHVVIEFPDDARAA